MENSRVAEKLEVPETERLVVIELVAETVEDPLGVTVSDFVFVANCERLAVSTEAVISSDCDAEVDLVGDAVPSSLSVRESVSEGDDVIVPRLADCVTEAVLVASTD